MELPNKLTHEGGLLDIQNKWDTLEGYTRNLYGYKVPITQALLGIDINISGGEHIGVLLVKIQMSIRGCQQEARSMGKILANNPSQCTSLVFLQNSNIVNWSLPVEHFVLLAELV